MATAVAKNRNTKRTPSSSTAVASPAAAAASSPAASTASSLKHNVPPLSVLLSDVDNDLPKEIVDIHDALAENIQSLADNVTSIATDASKRDKSMNILSGTIGLMTNYILNQESRLAVIAVYAVKVYTNKERIDKRDAKFFFSNDSLFDKCDMGIPHEIIAATKDFLHTLWFVHMNEKERITVWDFFKTYNDIAEDWIKLGGGDLLEGQVGWEEYYNKIRELKISLNKVEIRK